ncbi:MAG: hypothetical protein ABSC36_03140, partial [Gaiellaceae bacterium]
MDDLVLPAPESAAQPSSDREEEAIVADNDKDLSSLDTSQRLLADALVAALDRSGLPRRLATFVAAATSAEQVLLWLSDQPGTPYLGTPEELSPSDLAAARKRA